MEVPSHRACSQCRSQKVRCLPDASNPDVCQRCAKVGRACVFTPLQKRKQRKRTDTRVAELEREMRSMRALLKVQGDEAQGTGGSPPASSSLRQGNDKPHGDKKKSTVATAAAAEDTPRIHPAPSSHVVPNVSRSRNVPSAVSVRPIAPAAVQREPGDVIDRGLLSLATARQLVARYQSVLQVEYPMVYIPPSYTADRLRDEQPTLFLAVLAAAAVVDVPDLSPVLDGEILRTYAERALINSEKSLELVRALMVSATWYDPPKRFGQLKYYEYLHMAAIMSMEIGIGTRPASATRGHFGNRFSVSQLHPAEDVTNPDLSMAPRPQRTNQGSASTDARRTFLAVYCTTTACSMSLRRPGMVRPSGYLRECIEYMETCPDAIASDKTLIAWTRLSIIGTEISETFSFDDPANVASINDFKTQMMAKDFTRRLHEWESSISEADYRPALKSSYRYMLLTLYEIGLHVDHSPEDFKAPYQMGRLRPNRSSELPTRFLAECITGCIDSVHAMMDLYLALDANCARALPLSVSVRISYAAFIIAKLRLSSVSKSSRLSSLLDQSSLKADSYMDKLILHVRTFIGPQGCKVPAIFLALLFKVRQWCATPEIIEQPGQHYSREVWDDQTFLKDLLNPLTQQQVFAIEGPRVTEHVHDMDGSPQTVNSGAQPLDGRAEGVLNGKTPGAGSEDLSLGSQSSVTGSLHASPQTSNQPAPFGAVSDQMQVDDDFFSFLEDVNAYQGGGLTGLDDWGALPSEIVSTGYTLDTSNWQASLDPTNP